MLLLADDEDVVVVIGVALDVAAVAPDDVIGSSFGPGEGVYRQERNCVRK